jgi:hypothetical protein
MSTNPTLEEIIELSFKCTGWSTLFAIKHALIHHVDDWIKGGRYTGFLPYGSAVITFINSLESRHGNTIKQTPNYADHVYLQQLSNTMSALMGISSIELNNYMYLEGMKILANGRSQQSSIGTSRAIEPEEFENGPNCGLQKIVPPFSVCEDDKQSK